MKKVFNLLVLILLVSLVFASCFGDNGRRRQKSEAKVEDVKVAEAKVDTKVVIEEKISDEQRMEIEAILAKYIKARGISTFPNELFDYCNNQHKPTNYDEFVEIAKSLLYSEKYLSSTIYWDGGYVKEKNYLDAVSELRNAIKNNGNVNLCARKILTIQSAQNKLFIEMYDEFISCLEARKILIQKGFYYGNIETCDDYMLLEKAGISIGEGQIYFKYCGGEDSNDNKSLDKNYVNSLLANNKANYKLCEKTQNLLQKELSDLLINNETPLFNAVKVIFGNATPEEHKKAENLINKNKIS